MLPDCYFTGHVSFWIITIVWEFAVADPGGAKGAMAPPGPVKIGHKKMAAEGGRIDFMFLGPPLTRPLDPLLVCIVSQKKIHTFTCNILLGCSFISATDDQV